MLTTDAKGAAPTLSDGGEFAERLRRIFERRGASAPAVLGVLGSSRNDGNTGALLRAVFHQLDDAGVADLNALKIGAYDYTGGNEADDFAPLAWAMTKARAIVFASPVYWYSMSAQMKAFFDRLTDLTEAHKQMGKSLAGKHVFLVATGGSPAPYPAFEPPFAETAHYFDMKWGGTLYTRRDSLPHEEISEFAARINATIKANAA